MVYEISFSTKPISEDQRNRVLWSEIMGRRSHVFFFRIKNEYVPQWPETRWLYSFPFFAYVNILSDWNIILHFFFKSNAFLFSSLKVFNLLIFIFQCFFIAIDFQLLFVWLVSHLQRESSILNSTHSILHPTLHASLSILIESWIRSATHINPVDKLNAKVCTFCK